MWNIFKVIVVDINLQQIRKYIPHNRGEHYHTYIPANFFWDKCMQFSPSDKPEFPISTDALTVSERYQRFLKVLRFFPNVAKDFRRLSNCFRTLLKILKAGFNNFLIPKTLNKHSNKHSPSFYFTTCIWGKCNLMLLGLMRGNLDLKAGVWNCPVCMWSMFLFLRHVTHT